MLFLHFIRQTVQHKISFRIQKCERAKGNELKSIPLWLTVHVHMMSHHWCVQCALYKCKMTAILRWREVLHNMNMRIPIYMYWLAGWRSVNANRAHNRVSWCTFLTWWLQKSAFTICTYLLHWEFIGMPFCLWPTTAHAIAVSLKIRFSSTQISHLGDSNDFKIKNALKTRINHIARIKSQCNIWIRRFGKIHMRTRKQSKA